MDQFDWHPQFVINPGKLFAIIHLYIPPSYNERNEDWITMIVMRFYHDDDLCVKNDFDKII